MMFRTHIVFGIFLGLLIMPFINTGNKIIFFILVLLGSLMPDIDAPNSKISQKSFGISRIINLLFGHRGLFHSLFAAVLLSGLIYVFSGIVFALPFFIGYVSHLLIDGLTKSGVNLLYPIVDLRLSGFIETGSLSELVILISFSAIVLLQIIRII